MTCMKTVFLDMDGVLTDLVSAAFRLHDIPLDRGYPMGERDILKAAAIIEPTFNMSSRYFWDAMGHNFWAQMTAFQDYMVLVNRAMDVVGIENVFVATSPTLSPYSASGKIAWIQAYLPWFMGRQYFITPRKYLLANKDSLLIDDYSVNVNRFRERGGHAILVPRPWNESHKAASFASEITLQGIDDWRKTW